MALIKCPDCGKEISDKSEVCIHCGCPIKKKDQPVKSEIIQSNNKTSSTYLKYKKKKNAVLAVWGVLSLIGIVLAVVGFVTYKSGSGAPVLGIVGVSVSVVVLGTLLGISISFHVEERVIDGYSIVVYAGAKCILLIDGVVVLKKSSRNVYTDLPNGKHIHVELSAWDASPKIEVVNN